MFVVSEEVAARLVSIDDAIDAVRGAFTALARGEAEVFAVAGGTASDPTNRFSAKSGRIDGLALGIKIGTYWRKCREESGCARKHSSLTRRRDGLSPCRDRC